MNIYLPTFKEYQFLNESKFTDNEIRIYAWLYRVYLDEKYGMKESSWANDDRMGINFLEAMEYLEKQNLVRKEGNTWYSTSITLNKLEEVFGKTNNPNIAYKLGNKFEYLDTKEYKISSIPYSLYELYLERQVIDFKKHLEYDQYLDIKDWIKKYQRTPIDIPKEFKRYCGLVNDLIRDDKYALYKGIVINDPEIKYKRNMTIDDEGYSYSWNKNVAINFANGSKHYQDKGGLSDNQVGLLLVNYFKNEEVLFDFEFINQHNPYLKGIIDFPTEKEVIIFPMKRKIKILEVFN